MSETTDGVSRLVGAAKERRRAEITDALTRNAVETAEHEQAITRLRQELAMLLKEGKQLYMNVRAMAEAAHIGRERAYELIAGRVREHTRAGRRKARR